MNIKIRELKIAITNHLKGIDLPIEVKRLVLKEIYDDISEAADAEIREELKEREKQEGGLKDE